MLNIADLNIYSEEYTNMFNPSMQITVQLDHTYKKPWYLYMEFGRDRTRLYAIYFTRGTEGLIKCFGRWLHARISNITTNIATTATDLATRVANILPLHSSMVPKNIRQRWYQTYRSSVCFVAYWFALGIILGSVLDWYEWFTLDNITTCSGKCIWRWCDYNIH